MPIGLGAAALAILAVSPRLLGAALPLLIVAACPLSMVVMTRSTNRSGAAAGGASAGGPGTASGLGDPDAQVRAPREDVDRLRAEVLVRGEDRTV